MTAEAATTDLNVGTRDQSPRHQKRGRLTETGWLLVALPCVLLAGIGIGLLAWLLSSDGLNMHVLSIRLLSDLIDYLLVVAFIAISTLIAMKQLRRMIAADTAQTVRTIVREEIQGLLAEPGENIAKDLERIKDRLYLRADDDPTQPITHQVRPAPHVIGVGTASVYGGRAEAAIDRAADRMAERAMAQFDAHVDARLDDIQELVRNAVTLAGHGNVVGLPRARS